MTLTLHLPRLIQIAFACCAVMVAGAAHGQKAPVVVLGAGDVAPVVEQYRKLLSEPNNGNDAAKSGGRREINWDGVPDEQAAPAFLPADFFKARG